MEEYDYTPGGRRLTKHAARRLVDRYVDVDDVIDNFSQRFAQDDGAQVFVKRRKANGYDVVIADSAGIVTVLVNVSKREIHNLARNYGWR
ncbi:MAG: hypothetical protein DWI57_12525 [Chloroflexi bacterium]|nr:MAG: hypothetical protein DWI57_12525 [Chloroflexota bacterium]